jgi:hypothetical protein
MLRYKSFKNNGNPALETVSRAPWRQPGGGCDAACITAVDLCGGVDFADGVAILNRRGAWDALSILAEHQISVRKTKEYYNGRKSVYCHFELLIVGHLHSWPDSGVSRVCYEDNCRLRDGGASTVTYKLSLPPSRVPGQVLQVATYKMAKNNTCRRCHLGKTYCDCRQRLRRNAVEQFKSEMNM